MRIGYHISVAGGLVRAAQRAGDIGCECFQIFPRNARGWKSRVYPEAELAAFREARERLDLHPLVLHSNYLVNLAASDEALLARSRDVVADDLRRVGLLGAEFVVTHPGHAVGESVEVGLERLIESVRRLLPAVPSGVRFLLENMAGGDRQLGGRWEHFAFLLDRVDQDPRLAVCFDTCHAHAAGYRLDSPRWWGRRYAVSPKPWVWTGWRSSILMTAAFPPGRTEIVTSISARARSARPGCGP